MKSTKHLLIVNPRSNGGKAAARLDAIFSLMKQEGLEYERVFADTYEAIRDASCAAFSGDWDVVVAVGGDGTINAVINGFYADHTGAGTGKKLGVIYTGTSPDFCKSYGIPLEHGKAVRVIKEGFIRNIRIGSIRLTTNLDQETTETRYFSCCASIGIGAMVAEKANRYRKVAGDFPGTLGAILSSLGNFHPSDMIIKTGTGERVVARVTNIFVGRTRYIASGLKVNAELTDDDDRFYVICVNNLNLLRLPGLLRQLYSGNVTNSRILDSFYTGQISIYSEKKGTRVEFDGDAAGFAPCRIKAADALLPLITAQA